MMRLIYVCLFVGAYLVNSRGGEVTRFLVIMVMLVDNYENCWYGHLEKEGGTYLRFVKCN